MGVAEKKGWNPYLAGALSGVLSILSVWVAGKYFGASTTFVRSAGMVEKIIGSERVAHGRLLGTAPFFLTFSPEPVHEHLIRNLFLHIIINKRNDGKTAF